jgi:superfamily II DNA helicase RecQ
VRGASLDSKRGGKSKRRVREATAAVEHFSADQKELLQNLKAWRLRTATELDQPAFVIFSDKSLRDLVVKNPRSLGDLAHVYGFGPAKIERFGTDVLRELGN